MPKHYFLGEALVAMPHRAAVLITVVRHHVNNRKYTATPAYAKDAGQLSDGLTYIIDMMKHQHAHRRVHAGAGDGQFGHARSHELDIFAGAQPPPRGIEHRLGLIDRDHPLNHRRQKFGHVARAATDIRDGCLLYTSDAADE